jgi:uncharacterized protein (TIGR02145 family)
MYKKMVYKNKLFDLLTNIDMKIKKPKLISLFPITILILIFVTSINTNAQNFEIKFAAKGGVVTKLDSVIVENINQGIKITIPGTNTLHLGTLGSIAATNQGIIKIYPNPMQGIAELLFYAKGNGYTQIFIYDINGKIIATTNTLLETGLQKYQIRDLKQGMYVINIIGNSYSYTTKLVSQYDAVSETTVTYEGSDNSSNNYTTPKVSIIQPDMPYAIGDELNFTGLSGDRISQISDVPTCSKTISFNFSRTKNKSAPIWSCGDSIIVYHVAGNVDPLTRTVTYWTTSGIAGEPTKCWITQNLGALQQASSINDNTDASAGWYWQFNRKQGYDNNGTVRKPNTVWITSISENSDWIASRDPCQIDLPSGWRIPTNTEWTNVAKKWSDPWNSGLYLHHAGLLKASDGSLMDRGSSGLYWSSTQYNTIGADYLYFDWPLNSINDKAMGLPLRCINNNCITADAGPDQSVCDTSVILAGNNPSPGTGAWTFVGDSTGGNIVNRTSPTSTFDGAGQKTYTLRWTIYMPDCSDSYDDVSITFYSHSTTANAGPDQIVNGTSTTLAGNSPTIGTGLWSIVSGAGGTLGNSSLYNSSFYGNNGTTYTLVWTISNGTCPSSSDSVNITFQSDSTSCPGIPIVTYGGQIYHTVKIGTQCWLKENLNIGTKISGDSNQTSTTTIQKWCYNDDTTECGIYGGLYQWNMAMQFSTTEGAQGICPSGWHIPSDGEWTTLTNYLGGINAAGGPLKEKGTIHWTTPNTGATNSTGFTGLPGGGNTIFPAGVENFHYLNQSGTFNSSTEYNAYFAWGVALYYLSAGIDRNQADKDNGVSIRCLKN